MLRNAGQKIETRKGSGGHGPGDERVDDCRRYVCREPDADKPQSQQSGEADPRCDHHRKRWTENRNRHDRDGHQIAPQTPAPDMPNKRQPRRRTEPDCGLKLLPSFANQPVSSITPMLLVALRGQGHGGVRHLAFGQWCTVREDLDFGPVTVARREIHRGIGRVFAQPNIDQAYLLEEVGPVHLGRHAHRSDDITHGHVGCAKAGLRVCNHLIDGSALAVQTVLKPAQKRCLQWVKATQPFRDLASDNLWQWAGLIK